MRALLFEIQDVVHDVTAGNYGFLKDPCGCLRDRLLPTGFESHQNVIHSPVKIDSAPSISSF